MLKEFSCGAVVYKMENNSPLFLLVLSKISEKWGFPKGHVENGETEIETAKREIFEETGIKNLKFINNFRQEDVYIIKDATVEKHNIYFLAIAFEEPSGFDKNEISKIEWADISRAEKTLYFSGEREILKLAYKLIIGG
ncbi:MAG: NUDIX domain-containing protein [Endomicrobium sp.]|nr:NUDIX domain-containing protein [Endomicrobium sp.]